VGRVPGQEHPAITVPVGEHQPLRPLPDVERLVHHRHARECLEERGHLRVAVHRGVQRKMPGVVLHDEERGPVVGEVIVPALADRDPGEQVGAVEQRLAQTQQRLSPEFDAELIAHRAARTVTAGQVRRPYRPLLPVGRAHRRGDPVPVLAEAGQLAAEPHGDPGCGLGDLPE